ncbi:MAG: T9SS type A sorting domain-containing protein [Bacteroidia bacterium]|nr:T9SS type A sorting domain-containing protein [Bacteroidia bacterium]
MKYFILFFLLSVSVIELTAQPGTVIMTPQSAIPLTLMRIKVPAKFSTLIDSNKMVSIATGFEPHVFYMGGLTKPRFMAFSPEGVLHVIDNKINGAVYALPDTNMDDVADTLLKVVSGVNGHDFKFYKGSIYVAEMTQILKCSDLDQDGFFETKEVFISGIPGGGHSSRTIVFDSVNHKMYLSIGSSCNVCRETGRADIERFNDDGTGKKVFATGTRNAVGLTLHPKTNKLWANNNGSDNQGNNVPPEWIDVIREDGFYGHPFVYANQVWFNMEINNDYKALKPITAADSSRVAGMYEPAALIQSHSAPMAMEYADLSGDIIGKKGFVMALRGSWNRSPATGYKLVFLSQQNEEDKINTVSDFLTGFLTDSLSSTTKYWARPVGLAVQKKGSLTHIFMSSDNANTFILKLKDVRVNGLNEVRSMPLKIFPNPFKNLIQIEGVLPLNATLVLYNLMGEEQTVSINSEAKVIDTGNLVPGIYFLKISAGNKTFTHKIFRINEY